MSDRTTGNICVHACPTGQHERIAQILDERGYLKDWTEPVGPSLELGMTYGAHEVHGDESEEIVAEILDLFTEEERKYVVLNASTDPAYEWLGLLVIYAGGLGMYTAECDAQGQAVFNADQIQTAIAKGNLDTLLGTEHMAVLKQFP